MNSELYIFVIWESGRKKQDFLFKELEKKFVIREVYEITWNEKNFLNNMRRFYGPKLGDASKKISMCGTGSFLLILISDPKPKFEKRRTSIGMEIVNINLYDYKKIYRKITGLGYAIHNSVTYKETNDDLTLLLGKNTHDLMQEIPERWDNKLKKIDSDLIGQNGWSDINQLFYVLNSTVNYVVLRNFEDLPEKFHNYEHNDIDFMTDDFLRIPYITNGGKSPYNDIFPSIVKIGEKKIPFHFEHPRDGNYDEKWAKDILKRRVLYQGFYVPSKEDYFYSLFYHAVFHQRDISDEYKNKLMYLANELQINGITEKTLDNLEESKKIIEKYLNKMGYRHTDSTHYKIIHNKFSQLAKTSIYLWRVHGMKFLLTAIKIKIKRTTSKSPKLQE